MISKEELQNLELFYTDFPNPSIETDVKEFISTIKALQRDNEIYKRALERITVTFDRLPMVKIAEQALGDSHDTP